MKFLSIITTYLKEVRIELRRVNWPTKTETIRYTAFVIGFSIAVAALLGAFDFAYITIIRTVILK